MRRFIFTICLFGLVHLLFFIPPFRPLSVIILTLVLPGWGWANLLIAAHPQPTDEKNFFIPTLEKLILTLGLSYVITSLVTLGLHLLPEPISWWPLWLGLQGLSLLSIFISLRMTPSLAGGIEGGRNLQPRHKVSFKGVLNLMPGPPFIIFLLILLPAFTLRVTYLNYSEFQGDEALAMVAAADALEGQADALNIRSKGPLEVLLPMAVWRLNGLINEGLARWPFAIAGLGCLITLYLIAYHLFASHRVASYSMAFLAASGFMLGFSRIVQYQTLVIWMSSLAMWCLWRGLDSRPQVLSLAKPRPKLLGPWLSVFVSGLFLGLGFLAHYDAILVLPALVWLGIAYSSPSPPEGGAKMTSGGAIRNLFLYKITIALTYLVGFLIPTLPFYIPYLSNPRISQTGGYLEDRIGPNGLTNHLGDFFHFHSFYSSFYHLIILGFLAISFVYWALTGFRWGKWWLPCSAMVVMVGLSIQSSWTYSWTWTGLLFGGIFLLVFLSPKLTLTQRTILLWFVIPFWGYNFVVATPLTHIYTTLPGWALLAGWTIVEMTKTFSVQRWLVIGLNGLMLGFSTIYLWSIFLQPARQFIAQYPQSNPSLFLSPYQRPPQTGFFGFPYRAGWKAIGALIDSDEIVGDYDSNQKEAITAWYTRHTPRACDEAEFYFLVTSQAEPFPTPIHFMPDRYPLIAQVTSLNVQLRLHQLAPTSLDFGPLNDAALAAEFDSTATPAQFSRRYQWQIEAEANFDGLLRLRGYDLDLSRAYPGGRLRVVTYWEALASLSESYKLFIHLDSDKKYAHADGYPVCHTYPTTLWQPGQVIRNHQSLVILPNAPIKTHPLVIGWYDPETGRRLDILDVAGNPAGVSFKLTDVLLTSGRQFHER